jgi:hypothetical protein
VGDHSALVIEFPQVAGQYHFRYQFDVYDATGKFASRVALESDDVDQTSWVKLHPKEAAAGGRAFSLDGYSQTVSASSPIAFTSLITMASHHTSRCARM